LLRKLKLQIPGEPLTARCYWCQGPVPGRGPLVEKHCHRALSDWWRTVLSLEEKLHLDGCHSSKCYLAICSGFYWQNTNFTRTE